MRPKLVELILVVGFGKCGVFVDEMASTRISVVKRSLIVNRLRRFMSKSNRLGPFQLETWSMLPCWPSAEFWMRMLPLYANARSEQWLWRLYRLVMEVQ